MALWQPRTLPCSPPHSLLAVAPRSPRPFPPRRVPPRAKPRGEAASWVSDPCTSHSHGGRFAGGVEGERRAMRLRFNKGPPREASSAGATTKKQARKQARLGFLGGLWFLTGVSRGWGFCVVSEEKVRSRSPYCEESKGFNGWRSSDLPTAVAPRHPVRSARLHS